MGLSLAKNLLKIVLCHTSENKISQFLQLSIAAKERSKYNNLSIVLTQLKVIEEKKIGALVQR